MRILVTGSSGRIGRAIHAAASAVGDAAGLDLLSSVTTSHVGDFANPSVLARALRGVDAVFHVAALHAPHVGSVPDAEFRRINVDGTKALVDACVARGVGRIVFTSTTALFGSASTPDGQGGWVTEILPPEPRTIYHRTKLEAEAVLREAAQRGGPSVRILRMSRCFPERADLMAAYRLHRGIDARDVASGHVAAMLDTSPAASDLFILSGATPFVREDTTALWHDASAVFARRAPELAAAFRKRGWPLPPSVDRVYDSLHARIRLGWTPRFGFDEVLAQYERGSPEVLEPVVFNEAGGRT